MSNLAVANEFTNLKEIGNGGQPLKLAELSSEKITNTPPIKIDNKDSIHTADAHLRISKQQLDNYANRSIANAELSQYRDSLTTQIDDVFDAADALIKEPNELNAQNYSLRAEFARYRISQDLVEPSAHLKNTALKAQNILTGLTDDKRMTKILGVWGNQDVSIETITMENSTINHKTETIQRKELPKPAKTSLFARLAVSVKSFAQIFTKPSQESPVEQVAKAEKPEVALLEKDNAIPMRVRNTINAYRQGNYGRAFGMARGMGNNEIIDPTKSEVIAYAKGIGKRQDWAYEFKNIFEEGKRHDAKARIVDTIEAFKNNDIERAFKLSEKFPNADEMNALKGDKKLREQFLKIVKLSRDNDTPAITQAPKAHMG